MNHFSLPVRHGMTLGELAEMMNAVEHLGVDLEVVRVEGWSRDAYAEPQAWVAPSPHLRTLDQAICIPAWRCSKGRTCRSVAAPTLPSSWWARRSSMPPEFSAGLVSDAFRGVTVEPAEFTPTSGTHLGERCHGVRLRIVDRAQFEPVRAGLALAAKLAELYPKEWNPARLNEMIGNRAVTQAILAGQTLTDIEALFSGDLSAFRERRTRYLLYPPCNPR